MDSWPESLPSPYVEYDEINANGLISEAQQIYQDGNRKYPDVLLDVMFHFTSTQLSAWRTFAAGDPVFEATWLTTAGFTDHFARVMSFSASMLKEDLWAVTAQFMVSYRGENLWA